MEDDYFWCLLFNELGTEFLDCILHYIAAEGIFKYKFWYIGATKLL